MASAKKTLPPIRSRAHAESVAIATVQAEERLEALKAELKREADALAERYDQRIKDLKAEISTGTASLERWAAGDISSWRDAAGRPARSLVFDNGVQIEFTLDPHHVEPTPQKRQDGPIVAAILGPAEWAPEDDQSEADALLDGLDLSPADHTRLRKRYLVAKFSLDRDRIVGLYTQEVTASGVEDRRILSALNLSVEQGETFRVKRADRQPSNS